jgi:hypothetical protein
MSKNNLVFVSEAQAPDEWECVWEKQVTISLSNNVEKKQTHRWERLFKLKELKKYL